MLRRLYWNVKEVIPDIKVILDVIMDVKEVILGVK